MTEHIEKEKVMEILERTLNAFEDEGDKNAAMAVDMLAFEIKEFPAADVAPVVHTTTSGEYWDEAYCTWKTCDNCKGRNQSAAKYCNWCGARLDGEHHG